MNNKLVERKPIGDIKWPLEDNLPYLYATSFVLVETGSEFVLAFGNFLPTGFHRRSQEEVTNYLSGAEVNPIAKIVISKMGLLH